MSAAQARRSMSRVELVARSEHRRSAADLEADLQLACRTIGSIAGAARLTARSIDRAALTNAVDGLHQLLLEARAKEATE